MKRLHTAETIKDGDPMIETLKKAFLAASAEAKLLMVLSICDVEGNELMTERMSGAWLGSLDIARNKAFTAVAFSGPEEDKGLPTHELGKLAQPGKPLFGIQNTNQGRIVIFGGGYPIYRDGNLVGGLGVSGSTVPDDMKIAEATLEALK